jgi:hypothetical protein
MISGNVGGQVWFALRAAQAAPFGALVATTLIAAVACMAALSRRLGTARRRALANCLTMSTGKPVWRGRPRISLSDMASVHLIAIDAGARIHQSNSGKNGQAPSSIGLSPWSADPLLAESGIADDNRSGDPAASANGSAGRELPHEATSEGPG